MRVVIFILEGYEVSDNECKVLGYIMVSRGYFICSFLLLFGFFFDKNIFLIKFLISMVV